MKFSWEHYDPAGFYDELISSPGHPRPAGRAVAKRIRSLTTDEIRERQLAAELAVKTMGITFTVYADGTNIDRAWPYDIIPRTISGSDWDRVEAGLVQRLTALNLFIDDLYNKQSILKDGVVPSALILESSNFRAACVGMKPKHGAWAHICGSDLIRDRDGTFYVLEDNLRVPSGVSYMLENRKVTKRVFPELFASRNMRPIGEYTSHLFDTLACLSPRPLDYPEVVVLTPGIYNSAYFEHSYLAQQMGAELVEGNDLFVGDDDCVHMRTISGPARVDVIYRRIDDLFLDPEVFNPDSALGVRGLMRAWLKGNVALANAPGAGVADDKAVYTYVPAIIRYYLDQDAILPNVETYRCSDENVCEHVLDHLDELVVKPVNESGGYGMLVGPAASARERQRFGQRVRANPRNYVAQPLIALSTCPTVCGQGIEPRHLDLRPFILQGARHYVTPGGLTRVALVKGSFVVNSSQGGGSKDTWIVDDRADMLSRVAERVYWLGRYLERIENTARLVNVYGNVLLDLPRPAKLVWQSLIAITGSAAMFAERYPRADERTVVRFYLAEPSHSASLISSSTAARENARTVREILPANTWEGINDLNIYLQEHVHAALARRGRDAFLTHVINSCQLIVGSLAGTMSRDSAYQFLRAGRYLERADMTSRIVDVGCANVFPWVTWMHGGRTDPGLEASPYESLLWMSVLRSLDALQMYRRLVPERVLADEVVAFLLQDHAFPRAVAHCLKAVLSCLEQLPHNDHAVDSAQTALRHIATAEVADLIDSGLFDFIDAMQIEFNDLHRVIRETWFLPVAEPA